MTRKGLKSILAKALHDYGADEDQYRLRGKTLDVNFTPEHDLIVRFHDKESTFRIAITQEDYQCEGNDPKPG